jgi:hypothetical protein
MLLRLLLLLLRTADADAAAVRPKQRLRRWKECAGQVLPMHHHLQHRRCLRQQAQGSEGLDARRARKHGRPHVAHAQRSVLPQRQQRQRLQLQAVLQQDSCEGLKAARQVCGRAPVVAQTAGACLRVVLWKDQSATADEARP